jgi:hypothetical protein
VLAENLRAGVCCWLKKLDARIVHWGEPGRSIWSVFFKFNQLIEQDRVPDISVFCWSEPYRLYHPNLILSANTEPLEGVDPNVYRALDDYWKYLHSYDKDEMAYEYALNTMIKIYCQRLIRRSYRCGHSGHLRLRARMLAYVYSRVFL